jgi:hypothetical protein
LAPNSSAFLQALLAAETHLNEGQFLLEEQVLNKAKSLIYCAGTRKSTISKRKDRMNTKVNLNKR